MDINDVKWLQKVVPLLYNALEQLTQMEEPKKEPPRRRKRRATPSPPPSPERRPEESQKTEPQINRTIWVKEEYLYRDREGFFATTFENLYENNHEEFKAHTRMTPRVFDMLFDLVADRLTKNSIRTPISPECRLFLTLRYLASGEGTGRLAKSFKMGPSTVRAIVRETCDVLWTTLSPTWMAQPKEEELRAIVRGYQDKFQVPHCLGAVDAKRLEIAFKGKENLVLLAACDKNLIFNRIDIGSVFTPACRVDWHYEFGAQLFGEQEPEDMGPASQESPTLGHAFIASSAFPLGNQLITPYPTPTLEDDQLLYNQNLAIALEDTIDKAFRVLMSRWRVLSETIYCSKVIAEKLVRAAVVVHNFAKRHDDTYCPHSFLDTVTTVRACPSSTDVPTDWLRYGAKDQQRINSASELRDTIKDVMSKESSEPSIFEALLDSLEWN
ncbi:uncharacterized protein LOC117900564 [Drosophila subobscura]|uniref:uncharacterized protein LOC117900564 n=1 Tax=Drosophila subobscura TaxID=7241 RepID=UPI00155ACA45|nr:uncharacterized protein LOC117900564 [Drosophila subobscura]